MDQAVIVQRSYGAGFSSNAPNSIGRAASGAVNSSTFPRDNAPKQFQSFARLPGSAKVKRSLQRRNAPATASNIGVGAPEASNSRGLSWPSSLSPRRSQLSVSRTPQTVKA